MRTLYIMDACALIAFLRDEAGADIATTILKDAGNGNAEVLMNSLNLLEVYYDIYRGIGKEKADEELDLIRKLPNHDSIRTAGQGFYGSRAVESNLQNLAC